MEPGAPIEFGIVGLGRMGGGLALQALEKGLRVAGFEQRGPGAELVAAGLIACQKFSDFREHLAPPRVVFLYVPAGAVVDEVLDRLAIALHPGDILIDGGNSYWGDSIRRHARMRSLGLHFIDLGTSGGVSGARRGACFMAGGEPGPVSRVEPILKALAVENGYVHAGPPGAGHYTKLVHNGIEFGMLQAIAEGVALLGGYRDPLDIPGTLRCWRHGSVIRSWLVDLLEEAWRRETQPVGEDDAQPGDLRDREVDEHDAAREHLDAERDVGGDDEHPGNKGGPEDAGVHCAPVHCATLSRLAIVTS
jgi:6-phosphogluconate dehydrogenase